MARRIVGVTGISIWAFIVISAVVSGLGSKADGNEMFEKLPERWKVQNSFQARPEQLVEISRKLGGRLKGLSNTVLSVNDNPLQVNVMQAVSAQDAQKVYDSVLRAHKGYELSTFRKGQQVIEFAKCEKIELLEEARQVFGFEYIRQKENAKGLDEKKLFFNLPQGWEVKNSVTVPEKMKEQISTQLGIQIKKLTNTQLSVDGKNLLFNFIHCPTKAEALKGYEAILKAHKGHTGHVAIHKDTVAEFARCQDIELMYKVRVVFGLEPVRIDSVSSELIKKVPVTWQLKDAFVVPADETLNIAGELGGKIDKLSNAVFAVDGEKFQVNVMKCPTIKDAEKLYVNLNKIKKEDFLFGREMYVIEFVGDIELAKSALSELGIGGDGQNKGEALEKRARQIVSLLAESRFNDVTRYFDSKMKSALPADKLQSVWNSVESQYGPFVEQDTVRPEQMMGYEIRYIKSKFTKGFLEVKVVFDDKQQVSGLFIIPEGGK